MVSMQLEDAGILEKGVGAGRLAEITAGSSISQIAPALPAVHGLGTGGYNLYSTFSFDHLHVRLSEEAVACSANALLISESKPRLRTTLAIYCHCDKQPLAHSEAPA